MHHDVHDNVQNKVHCHEFHGDLETAGIASTVAIFHDTHNTMCHTPHLEVPL